MKNTVLESTDLKEGMTIETMVAKFMNNQTDIERENPLIYTERRDGVLAGLDIRTDRFEVAIDGMDKSAKSIVAKRQSKMTVVKEELKEDSVAGTEGGEA